MNECGAPLAEQTSEAGVHSEGVELESGGDLVTATTPTLQASPGALTIPCVL
jgi:hypothetical protein